MRFFTTRGKGAIALALAASLATLLLVLAAGPAGADPGKKIPVAWFVASVKGVQKTTETFHHKPENGCDVTDDSSLTERVVFQSRPEKMFAADFAGHVYPSILVADDSFSLPTVAKLTRHYTPRISVPPASPECGENDGDGEEELKPDCGTKRVTDYELRLESDQDHPGLIVQGQEHEDPFEECLEPVDGLGFPNLLAEESGGRKILGDLPKDEIYDTGLGQIIVLGGGARGYADADVSAKTTIEWDISLRRIPTPKNG